MTDKDAERENILDKLLAGSLLELDPTHVSSAKPESARNIRMVIECDPDKIDKVITFLTKLRDNLKAKG